MIKTAARLQNEVTRSAAAELDMRLLATLARRPLAGRTREDVCTLLLQFDGWDRLLREAQRIRLAPLILSNLRSLPDELIPERIRREIVEQQQMSRAEIVAKAAALMQLLDKFRVAGIEAIVLKGPSVALLAHGELTLRSIGDFDLLVRREHLAAAGRLLVSEGYDHVCHARNDSSLVANQDALDFSRGTSTVDLHWALLSRHLYFELDIEEIWDRAHEVDCLHGRIRVLAPEYLFLYLCAHGTKHEWGALRWVSDIALLSQRLDPVQREAVLKLAARTRSRRILALALQVAAEVFGDDANPFGDDALVPPRDTARLLRSVRASLGLNDGVPLGQRRLADRLHPHLGSLLFWMDARESWFDRMRCIMRTIFVPPESATSGSMIFWIRRPFRVASRAIKRMRGTRTAMRSA